MDTPLQPLPQQPIQRPNEETEALGYRTEPPPVDIEYIQGHVTMFHLTEERLDSVAGCGDQLGIYLTFLGISVGAFIALGGIVWLTPPTDPFKHAVVLVSTVSSGLLGLFFLIMSGFGYTRRRRQLKEIKRTPTQSLPIKPLPQPAP